jgi:hypothetical protein
VILLEHKFVYALLYSSSVFLSVKYEPDTSSLRVVNFRLGTEGVGGSIKFTPNNTNNYL